MDTQEWINSREGADLLGVKQPNFLYYAKRGEIAVKEDLGEHQDRLYSRSDAIKVRQRLLAKARIKHPKPAPVTLDWLQITDLPAAMRLDQIVYHDIDLGELATYQSWRRKNVHISIAAFDATNREIMLGYVTLVPVMSEQICIDILAGKRADHSITADEIDTYDRPGAYTLLGVSAVCHPARPDLLYPMLKKHVDAWIEAYPERYIKKIYAQTFSERGEMLVQHLFMAPRPDLAYNAYELDMARPSASRLIRSFKQSLEAIEPLPDVLRWPPIQTAPAPAQPAPVTERRPITPRLPTFALPGGLIPFRLFAGRHGIADSTTKNAIDRGDLAVTEGEWHVGNNIIKKAFDTEQQRAFIALYQHHKSYHQCSTDDCPCHQA